MEQSAKREIAAAVRCDKSPDPVSSLMNEDREVAGEADATAARLARRRIIASLARSERAIW